MTERILDFSERPARLSVRNGLLVIDIGERSALPREGEALPYEKNGRDPESGLRNRGLQEQTIPLADIAVVIVAHPQISFSHAVLSGLAEAGGMFIACNQKRMPCAMLLPLDTHSTQTERFQAQASLPLPNRKRLWQQVAKAKIRAQARLLKEHTEQDWGLEMLAAAVRSGDPQNVEARAARIYWKNLFGEDHFRRNPEGEGLNPLLNYGYAILRAVTARALCAAGLHPSLGIHHHNRYDTFCLADDLMEPFRPIVDRAVAEIRGQSDGEPELDRQTKRAILEALLGRFAWEGESRTLFDWVSRTAQSLASAIESGEKKLEIPLLEPGRGAGD
ncbi:MAG TPA: type II CRISPR-associated endonuclease Cas1 [Terriglobia bacterium]|nr:type II CRISPR-associated endonuclease Cas1 [Terriglobia bacterium]